ncbi:alpha/beta hydrolase-fold protein [Maribacter sp. PR1]|uniref:Alpha/beta hydrolase-fold protein n=1 Tax=Maribacter cobaltidurans TaxID=1178778 RepID=A0ABU7IP04_9FLAO|nr:MULTISPECIES: esterase [Maribacter]MDC6387291.1 alpha/beta hydrolase-fold protein [Maribacter sp. PR1]MEE1974676.1 alpha/beta hydrolase-fold protein [Maribacter cobaltidurans]
MTKTKIMIALVMLLAGLKSNGQEALFGGQEIVSPEINKDKSVTFRLLAPAADSVFITGDFLPTTKMKTPMGEMDAPGKKLLSKNGDGLWTYTTETLPSELYNYSFIVDGMTIRDPNNPFVIRDVSSLTNIFIIGKGKADSYKVNDVPHGTVAKRWYDSPGLGMDRRITIYTPPGYEDSKEEYPVLYLLHGAGGDEEAWMDLGRTSQIIDNLIAEGKAQPMIIAMPNGNVTQDAAPGKGSDGFYKPVFMAPKTMDGTYEAYFMDIIKFVESNYRVKANKENRAIAGLSMGGFHSFHISRYYPNMFDYVGLFSAAIMPREDATGEVYNNINETLEQQHKNGLELYYIAIGKTDFLYKANQDLKKQLDEIGMPYEYVETDGGHIWRNWRIYLTDFAPKLFK